MRPRMPLLLVPSQEVDDCADHSCPDRLDRWTRCLMVPCQCRHCCDIRSLETGGPHTASHVSDWLLSRASRPHANIRRLRPAVHLRRLSRPPLHLPDPYRPGEEPCDPYHLSLPSRLHSITHLQLLLQHPGSVALDRRI